MVDRAAVAGLGDDERMGDPDRRLEVRDVVEHERGERQGAGAEAVDARDLAVERERDELGLGGVARDLERQVVAGRARALAFPAFVLDDVADLKAPIGIAHPLVVAAAVAGLGGRPADPASLVEHEDAVLARLDAAAAAAGEVVRPHDDPDPARRVARRILQRLNGMGKWGGYHTEFAHLARGFAGNHRKLAEAVGEALLEAGLLAEKPSVGQRHVFLNPRRAADIHTLIERGDVPADLKLPQKN